MDEMDNDLRELTLHCYSNNFEQAIPAIEAFELKYKGQVFSDRIRDNMVSLKGEAYFRNGRFEDAIALFKKLYDAGKFNSLWALRIAAALKELDRDEEAAAIIKHEVSVEPGPNYLLNLLFWYVSNLKYDNAELVQYRPDVDKIVDYLGVAMPDDAKPVDELIKYLKEESLQANHRYGNFLLAINNNTLSTEVTIDRLRIHIAEEKVGFYKKIFQQKLSELEDDVS
ncbi:MAG: tetratricopeptide repeat protein [Bacteroidota bacterium]